MITWTLNDQQEAAMKSWLAAHDKDKHCPAYKKRKQQEKLRAKGKGNPYGPCGGSAQYQIEIALTAVGDLASVKCTECGKDYYLGEV